MMRTMGDNILYNRLRRSVLKKIDHNNILLNRYLVPTYYYFSFKLYLVRTSIYYYYFHIALFDNSMYEHILLLLLLLS